MKFFQLVPSETNIDFIGKFKLFTVLSGILIVVIVLGMIRKGLNYGIDFTGGTVMQIRFANPTGAEEAREVLTSLGEKDASVVAVGNEQKDYMITVRALNDIKNQVPLNTRLIEKLGDKVKVLQLEAVGAKVGSELRSAALRSLFYAIILITIYIWLRFDIRFAPGATVAMIHDIILATGFYLFTGKEFTITAIAALLTIAGYSVNDTIVIYDRVREMYKLGGKDLPLPQTINKAVNLTLSRTLLTALITLISIVPLVIFCDGEIQNFAFAMLIGVFVGAYSTVYIAAPFTMYVDRFLKSRENSAAGRVAPLRG